MQKNYIFLALILVMAVQAIYYFPLLPDEVASNFDFSGEANSFQDKADFYLILFSTLSFVVLVMIGSAHYLHKIPHSLINIPHRDYWLADERKAETFRRVKDRMIDISIATMILFIGIFQLTVNANLGDMELGSSSIFLFFLYLGYTIYWVVLFYRDFRIPK